MFEPKPCPVCGCALSAALADAIGNPDAPETCPAKPFVPTFIV
jgi:hypothetical protein